jgi:hypothetical protein
MSSINSTDDETSDLLARENIDAAGGQEENDYLLSNSARSASSSESGGGITWYFAVFLIVNAALGAGLLNFSKAYDNAGGVLISSIIHLVKSTLMFTARHSISCHLLVSFYVCRHSFS